MEDEEYYDGGEDDYDMTEVDDDIALARMNSQRTLVWKTSSDIYTVIGAKVKDQMDCLNLDFDSTLILFKHFVWNRDKLESEYFLHPELIKKLAGLPYPNMPRGSALVASDKFTCPACFETTNSLDHLLCNHTICTDCWERYIKEKTLNQNKQMFFKCPMVGCSLIVPQTMILKYLREPKEQDEYFRNLGRAFCSESKTMKWCPAPDCDFAVENANFTHQYVECFGCTTKFCFKCGKENHSPCTCEEVAEWDLKNLSESENLRWIQLYTKLCPTCRKPIEKNQGCNHMTCKPPNGCGFDFCWLCLGDWKQHSESTGGFYKCNKFEGLNLNEQENKKKEIDKEKSMLEKYIFYFERFIGNMKAEKQATKDRVKIQENIKLIHSTLGLDQQYLQFLIEANNFLIEGRRCLKWTYCYAFYLDVKKKDLFEDQQSYLEKTIELLHSKIEKTDYQDRFIVQQRIKEFEHFKIDVVNLTQAGIKFKKGILESYETGMF